MSAETADFRPPPVYFNRLLARISHTPPASRVCSVALPSCAAPMHTPAQLWRATLCERCPLGRRCSRFPGWPVPRNPEPGYGIPVGFRLGISERHWGWRGDDGRLSCAADLRLRAAICHRAVLANFCRWTCASPGRQLFPKFDLARSGRTPQHGKQKKSSPLVDRSGGPNSPAGPRNHVRIQTGKPSDGREHSARPGQAVARRI